MVTKKTFIRLTWMLILSVGVGIAIISYVGSNTIISSTLSAIATPPPSQSSIKTATIPSPGQQPMIAESALHVSDLSPGTTWRQISGVPWTNHGGDWIDLNGVLQGKVPWATATIVANNTQQALMFNVTDLVRRNLSSGANRIPNRGWLVRKQTGSAIGAYYSKEYVEEGVRPKLSIVTSSGTYTLTADADTAMSPSAYESLGAQTTMVVDYNSNIALWFNLSSVRGTITSAKLTLTSTNRQFGSGSSVLSLYLVDLNARFSPVALQRGIAASYPNDVGIEKDLNVIFVEHFQDSDLANRGWWSASGEIIGDSDPTDTNYRALAAGVKSYKISIAEGGHVGRGGDSRWLLWSNLGYEPEELYIRTYARLGTDFDSGVGKFPFGFDGTYVPIGGTNAATGRAWNRPGMPTYAGNGALKSTGRNGWSARGLFSIFGVTGVSANPLTAAGYRGLGYYVYHAEQTHDTGDLHLWTNGFLGLMPKNQWFAIDEYVKLNSVNADGSGNKDGILRAWINGRLAYEKTDYLVRHWPGNPAGASNIKIYSVWLNFYHGGSDRARSPMVVYLANMVFAKTFVGPTNVTGTN